MDCFVAALLAMTKILSVRHCERSEAIHIVDYHVVLRTPRNDTGIVQMSFSPLTMM